MHGTFQALEQILVIDNVAVFLIVPVETVHAANSLEQAMVPHLFIDVEIGR